jgi:DNA-binding SARP family transcriptional activator
VTLPSVLKLDSFHGPSTTDHSGLVAYVEAIFDRRSMEDDIALRLLGPVTVRTREGWVSPGPPQQRLMLAVLALNAGRVVPVPELIDAVWEERPPRSVRASLYALVTHVRQFVAVIPGAGFDRCGDGYRLRADPARVDLHRFRSLARSGRDAVDGRPAVALFDEALAL